MYVLVCLSNITRYTQEELEDTKGLIRIRILKKSRQHNGQEKKCNRTKINITYI